jgi:hypothetical protein
MHLAFQKYHPQSLAFFPLHPLASLLMLIIMWRSAILITRSGGVWWRETFYPLPRLKSFLRKSDFLP